MKKQYQIGLFGFGHVGQGFASVLTQSNDPYYKIKTIVVRDPHKKRPDSWQFSTSHKAILDDPDIDLVVEAISDLEEAYRIVATALQRNIPVISASKAMLSKYLEELTCLSRESGTPLRYEAAVCGGIQILDTLDRYFGAQPIRELSGIFNGTSNYILSQMEKTGLRYEKALEQARLQGFAEADPSLDVSGEDARYKLALLSWHAYGLPIRASHIPTVGIEQILPEDLAFAAERGFRIRLVGNSRIAENKLVTYLLPQLVDSRHPLYRVEDEFNGVWVDSSYTGGQLYIGRGAGSLPTGSALYQDMLRGAQWESYANSKSAPQLNTHPKQSFWLEVWLRGTQKEQFAQVPFFAPPTYQQSAQFVYARGYVPLRWIHPAHLQNRRLALFSTGRSFSELQEIGPSVQARSKAAISASQ